jgi:S1-C subfamily serine protease
MAFGQDATKEEPFYSQAQRAIVKLTAAQGTATGTATAFFVRSNAEFYIVTAAHVANASFDSFTATVPLKLADSTSVNAHMVLAKNKWITSSDRGDPTHFSVDVAAMKVIEYGGIMSFHYCSPHCDPNNPKDYNQLDNDPSPPDVVMVFGFPLVPGLLKISRPLGRQGIVAFVDADEDTIVIENKYFDRRGILIDIPTIIGGNSGSPVIKIPLFGSLTLVGLISGANLGGGSAVAEPVSRIKELLDSPEMKNASAVDPWCMVSEADQKRAQTRMPVCTTEPAKTIAPK